MRNAKRTLATVWLLCLGLTTASFGEELERGWTLVREDLELFIDPAAGTLRIEGTLVAKRPRGFGL